MYSCAYYCQKLIIINSLYYIFGRFAMNDKLLEQKIERFFLLRLRDQLKYIPLNEALDFKERKEVQKMIRDEIGSKAFRREIDKVFKQEFDDALRAAFGVQGRGKTMSGEMAARVASEVGSEASQKQILKICKKLLEKFYKEIALRYPFIIRNLRI